MRVVHLSRTFLHPTETFVYTQLTHLPPEKAMVVARDGQHLDRFPGVNLRAFSLEPENWHTRWSNINYRALRRMSAYERQFFLRAVQALGPDILHAHFAVDAAYFIDIKRQARRPLVVSCYGYDVSSFLHRYLGWGRQYLRPVWRDADLILAMSQDMRGDLLHLGCPPEKIRVHYHGINLARFPSVERAFPSSSVRILFVGSLYARKGVEDVLRAFAELAGARPKADLRFVGQGPLYSNLKELARTLGLESRVSFAGFVRHEDLHEELNRAHIFCHPSQTLQNGDKEGIPGTIVEAMATGLPVVTTRHAGIPEMVRDGEDGFVVGERDIPALAEALLTLVDKPDLRAHMGRQAARQAQQKADAIRLTAELETIYGEVMASARVNGSGG
jgi:colanic acid/amylovoran biosynthesis glycosyltransferase